MSVCLSLYKKWVKVYVSFSGFMPEVLASKIGSGFVGTSTNSSPLRTLRISAISIRQQPLKTPVSRYLEKASTSEAN